MWNQVYDPLGSEIGSTLLAALPTILLLGLLATGRVSAPAAALAGLVAALAIAIGFYVPEMNGLSRGERIREWWPTMLAAAANGAAFGLLPIGWIVFAAIFLYNLTVASGQFEIVKRSVASLSDDRRIQALLIAFSFGAFVEGAAGFGTPVAISAALLMGSGFKPLYAAGLALIANTSPVAFGALGTPIITLARVTGLGELELSAMAGRQLPIFSLIVPVWLVWVMAGWRGVVGVWPALLVCGGSFALVQYLVSNWHGPWLVDVAGGLISLVALALFLRVWQPKQLWHFDDEAPPQKEENAALPSPPVLRGRGAGGEGAEDLGFRAGHAPPSPRPSPPGIPGGGEENPLTTLAIVNAWIPWMLLTLFVFAWGTPQFKDALGKPTAIEAQVPHLHQVIARTPPVVSERKAEDAIYKFNWLDATGTGIFLAAVLSALWLRMSPARFANILVGTLWSVRWPLFTIACMLAIAFTTRYSGMDATLGLAFTKTGWLYPFFAPLLGWLGVALTGSDTSSNALFGSLQTITANRLVDNGTLALSSHQAQVLLATANSTGGVMGKMIDAQSIVVAAVATKQDGQEGPILRFVFWHSLILALLMGVLVMVQAYWWTASIPAR
jgi:lactate permease